MALRPARPARAPAGNRAPEGGLSAIYGPIGRDLARTDRLLARAARESRHVIRPMARHLLRHPGKRIRAALVLFSARTAGPASDKSPQLAAAVEMLHAASLIHDDIIDEAALRHNQPALHARWGTQRAVLMGDYLFARIFSLLAEGFPLAVSRCLLSAAQEVCDGAIEETSLAFRSDTTEPRYLEVIKKKTASLMAAACECGAIVAGAPKHVQEGLRRYGKHFGIAFQLIDDALNFTGRAREIGKPVGSDIAEGKFTMPVLRVRRLMRGSERRRLVRLLGFASLSNGGAKEVIGLVRSRGGVDHTLKIAREYLDRARGALRQVPAPARDPLMRLADYALIRRK